MGRFLQNQNSPFTPLFQSIESACVCVCVCVNDFHHHNSPPSQASPPRSPSLASCPALLPMMRTSIHPSSPVYLHAQSHRASRHAFAHVHIRVRVPVCHRPLRSARAAAPGKIHYCGKDWKAAIATRPICILLPTQSGRCAVPSRAASGKYVHACACMHIYVDKHYR